MWNGPLRRPDATRRQRWAVEPLERRVHLTATVGSAAGSLEYVYPLAGGGTATVPLADRTVYDDVDGSGTYAMGDPVAVTDVNGRYALPLASASETVRVLPRPGWTTADGSPDSATASPGGSVTAFDLTMTSAVVVDVVAAYTSSAPKAYSLTGASPVGTIAALFAYANQVQADSDTNVRINLVGTVPTGYHESGTFAGDLQTLAGGGPADVAAARKADVADLTLLFEGDANRSTGGEIGLAYEFSRGRPIASLGVGIVSLLGNQARDGITLAHELGHLLGADHDLAHATGIAAAPYAHGLVFVGDDGTTYQDVMSYGTGTVLPFYSTPAAFDAGRALGRATNSDNARAVREAGPAVARYAVAGEEGPATAAVTPLVQSIAVKSKGRGGTVGGTAGLATLTLTNAGAAAVTGTGSVALALMAQGSPDGATPFDTVAVPVTLRPGQSRSIPIKFAWPMGLSAGTYQLLATVSVGGTFAVAGDAGEPVAVAAAAVAYRPPTVTLSATATTVRAHAGRPATVRIVLHNAGNVAAVGTVSFAAQLSAADGSGDPVTVSVAARPINVAAGRTQTIPASVTLPAGLATGSYRLSLQLTPLTSPVDAEPSDVTVTVPVSSV